MGAINKLKRIVGREAAGGAGEYECRQCGDEFTVQHYTCPSCGSYSVERATWEREE